MFTMWQKIKIVDKFSYYNGVIGKFKRYLSDNLAEVFLFDNKEVHMVMVENLEEVEENE